jgi:RND superfamily putative drug exporter
MVASGPVFKALSADQDINIESINAYDVLDAESKDDGTVVGVVDRIDPASAATKSQVTAAAAALRKVSGVTEVEDPYSGGPAGAALIAKDQRAVVIVAHLAKDAKDDARDATVETVTKQLRGIDLDGAKIEVGGSAVLDKEINEQVGTDLSRAEMIALPITLLVMVLVFGGFVAAGLPVLGAIMSIGTAFLALWGFSTFSALDSNTLTVTTLLGLGLSIDYGLLVLTRYREELGNGLDRESAVSKAAATSGRTVAFSALTVAAALGGLVMVDVPFMQALGAAGVSIALMTMLVALTLMPALIRIFGRWIKPPKKVGGADHGFFSRLALRVQRRPVMVIVVTLFGLLAIAAPAVAVNISDPGLGEIPTSIESRRVVDDLTGRFGQQPDPPITVLARTDPATLDAWAAQHAGDQGVTKVFPAEEVRPGLSMVDIDVAGDPHGSEARGLVKSLRADRPDVESWVTGDAAVFGDLLDILIDGLPGAIAVMVGAMFVLLFLMTGSLLVPVKALVMNLLSLGATFGAMVMVFQHGWGAGPLDFLVNDGMDPYTLLAIFAFAFGLSMDYEVFLLARIKELYDKGYDNDTAVRLGLQRSGRIITSAAVLMMIVFGGFAAAKIGGVEQIGFGLVVAVLVDATIVRCLLVPATMTLLGKANWWAPKPLRLLHAKFGLREAPPAQPEPDRELTPVG